MQPQNVLLQTCVEAYRMPVFNRVIEVMGDGFHLATGMDYFTPALKTVATDFLPLSNQFILKRSLCYQVGWFKLVQVPGTIVAELNPRILSTWFLFFFRWLLGRRSIFWGHVSGRSERGYILKIVRAAQLGLADGMITYTQRDADVLRANGFSKQCWTASNSCVAASDCVPVASGGNRLVYVGRLVVDKKPQLLLEGFIQVAETDDDIELHFVGDGPERKSLEEYAAKQFCSERIHFHGRITDPESLRQVYTGALAAVSPGYVGLSCIQAMALGIPMIIARNEPHAPEIEVCRENIDTVFFKENDSNDLARCVLDMKANAAQWSARASSFSDRIKTHYTTDSMAKVIVSAFRGDT